MVGVRGLEPRTSGPPALRATNYATPRTIGSADEDKLVQNAKWVAARADHDRLKYKPNSDESERPALS